MMRSDILPYYGQPSLSWGRAFQYSVVAFASKKHLSDPDVGGTKTTRMSAYTLAQSKPTTPKNLFPFD